VKLVVLKIKNTIVIGIKRRQIIKTITGISASDILVAKEVLAFNLTITITVKNHNAFGRRKPFRKTFRHGRPLINAPCPATATEIDIFHLQWRSELQDAGPSHAMVETINPRNLVFVERFSYQEVIAPLKEAFNACHADKQNRLVQIDAKAKEQFASGQSNDGHFEKATIGLMPLGRGNYQLDIDAKEPVWFRIKLSAQPGLSLYNAAGQALPLYRGNPHVIGYAKGQVFLRYERTWVMWLSYLVSCLSVILLWWFWRQHPGKNA
jgi:hypothetical protein